MECTIKGPAKLSLHKEANEQFKMGYFNTAIKLYTDILKNFNPRDMDILANRSIAYLKVGIYKLALLDSEAVLQINPSHQKAFDRKVKSLWGLRRYEEAICFIESKLSKPQRELALYKELEMKSRKFLKQANGEFDMREIIKLMTSEFHEFGEYIGPTEVVNIPGKGRGVIATADLSPGQLVMFSKAFAVALGIETPEVRKVTLFGKIVGKLINEDEDLRKQFRKLSACAGPDAPPPTWIWSNTDEDEEQILMFKEVDLRMNDNMFINYRTTPISCGIWTAASYFNNDCIDANVHIQYFGDGLMIRALNQISKGEELTLNKFPLEQTTSRKNFMKEGKFECKCRLCIFEAQESEETKNEVQVAIASLKMELMSIKVNEHIWNEQNSGQEQFDVIDAFENLSLPSGDISLNPEGRNFGSLRRKMNSSEAQLKKALKCFKRIVELRSENPSLNVVMFDAVVLELSWLLFHNCLFMKCIEVLETARQTLNCAEGITSDIFASDQLIISCYLKLGNYNKIMEWIRIFKTDLVRASGTVEILRETGRSFLAQFDNLEIGLDFFSL